MLLAGRGSCGVLAKASLLLAQPALHLDPSDSVSGQETVEEALAVKAGQLHVATMIREEVSAPSGPPCVWLARARQQAVCKCAPATVTAVSCVSLGLVLPSFQGACCCSCGRSLTVSSNTRAVCLRVVALSPVHKSNTPHARVCLPPLASLWSGLLQVLGRPRWTVFRASWMAAVALGVRVRQVKSQPQLPR